MFLDQHQHHSTDSPRAKRRGRRRKQQHHHGTTIAPANMLRPQRQALGANATTACCLWSSLLLLASSAFLLSPLFMQPSEGLQLLISGEQATDNVGQQQPLASLVQHQEILVQPNSQVRIECKLPQLSISQSRFYYWNFQRTLNAASKPQVLCFESKCIDEKTSGIQLEMDRENGNYDLLINNVTYEAHDGFYYCDYTDSTPESKQTINREVRLTVLIPPHPPTILAATEAPAREGQEFQLNCLTQGGNPEPNITWFRNEQPLQAANGLRIEQQRTNGSTTSSLTWIPSIEDHQAVYKCLVWNKAMSSMQAFEHELRLLVEYAPRIAVGPFNPLKVLQGAQVTLPCSVDANPAVKNIRWFKDGHFISNQYNYTIQDVKISDSSVYSCVADNGIAPLVGSLHGQVLGPVSSLSSLFSSHLSDTSANNQISKSVTSMEAQLHLQVLYPPKVQVKVSKLQPLNEGDFFSLNCSVDSSPPAHEFIWTKQDDPSFRRSSTAQSPYLEFHSISASDMGNYTCTAFNRLDPSAQAAGYNQAPFERQASNWALVQVRHKPGMAEISIGQQGETELGAKTQIQCRAKPPGFPEAQYKFWKYQGSAQTQRLHLNKQAHGSVYTIYSAKADDEAKYGCMAINEMGASSEADGDLIVNEAPTIIHDTSARRDEDARPPGDFPYSITVRASGKPEPKVSWFHRSPIDKRRLELSSAEMQSRFSIETITKTEQNQMGRPKFNVYSTLTFKSPLEVDDRGLYSVEFNNGLSRSAIEHFQLHINHPPIPAPQNQPIAAATAANSQQQHQQTSTRTKAGFNLGETVNLTCRVSAYPKPEFLWYANSATESDKPIETNSRYRTSISNPRDDIWESTLTFSQAQEADYGEYMCVTANHDQQANRISDSVQILVNLSRKTIPDAPIQLEAIEATQDSITLQWIAGFDGGFAQNQYLMQYAPDDNSGLSLSKRYPGADSLDVVMAASGGAGSGAFNQHNSLEEQQQAYPKLYDCLSMNPCTINQLQPRQAYVFRLRAKNELGFSEFSEELRATTRANMSQIPRILDASFDNKQNKLHFRIEPGSDYLLNNLNVRIETRSLQQQQQQPAEQQQAEVQQADLSQRQQQLGEWRLHSTMQITHERAELHLSMPVEPEQLRLTLCARSNESLCGPEFVVSYRSATSSFLLDQRGATLSILVSSLTLIVVLGALATTVHSCCLSRKSKNKASSIERADGGGAVGMDNKPISADSAIHKGHSQHGSTTSTNSTSMAANSNHHHQSGALQSMDSINGALNGGGSASDHSSDHSRQAKLDSMLPPNYNHYADRASIMMEQQQSEPGKLASPCFGLPNSALLSVANNQQLPSPMMNPNLAHFAYGQLEPSGQQQPMSLEQHMMDHSSAGLMHSLTGSTDPTDGGLQLQQQQQLWAQQQDDYNNYNALGFNAGQQQHSAQDQMIDPTYGTTGSVLMSGQHNYNDLANGSSQHFQQAYNSLAAVYQQPTAADQQQQQRYQQEIAVAQQQMYGTLTRNGYSASANNNSNTLNANNNDNGELGQQHYSTTNGLMQANGVVSQESDYGTTGRSGRLIREIIV